MAEGAMMLADEAREQTSFVKGCETLRVRIVA